MKRLPAGVCAAGLRSLSIPVTWVRLGLRRPVRRQLRPRRQCHRRSLHHRHTNSRCRRHTVRHTVHRKRRLLRQCRCRRRCLRRWHIRCRFSPWWWLAVLRVLIAGQPCRRALPIARHRPGGSFSPCCCCCAGRCFGLVFCFRKSVSGAATAAGGWRELPKTICAGATRCVMSRRHAGRMPMITGFAGDA